MDISLYHISHLLRTYTRDIENKNVSIGIDNERLDNSRYDAFISLDGKKTQLFDQLISEAIAYFTTGSWEKNGRKITGDILRDLSGANRRRDLYGTLIQDSRRR